MGSAYSFTYAPEPRGRRRRRLRGGNAKSGVDVSQLDIIIGQFERSAPALARGVAVAADEQRRERHVGLNTERACSGGDPVGLRPSIALAFDFPIKP